METTPGREKLAHTIDVAEWGWLRAHLERGGLIVVAPDLDLAETGRKVAADDTDAIRPLIAAGRLAKPSREQVAAWDKKRAKKFRMLIVSPYVLIQEESPAKGDER